MGRDERTLQMMKNFIKHHDSGMGIFEIAQRYDLSTRTVYSCLGEIAEKAGVLRESLLETPHLKPHFPLHSFKPVKPVDMRGFRQHYETTMKEIKAVRTEIKENVRAQEKIADRALREEEKWQSVV